MPLIQQLRNLQKEFTELKYTPVLLNDYDISKEETMKKFVELALTTYTQDMVDVAPSCSCKQNPLQGQFMIGIVCRQCGEPVKPLMDEDISPRLWIKSPDDIAPFINPKIWIMITGRFKKNGFNIIHYLTNTRYKYNDVKHNKFILKLKSLGINQRGYNYFVNNFFSIMNILSSMNEFKIEDDALQRLITENPDCIFTRYLGMPHKCFLILEKTNFSTFHDKLTPQVLNIMSIISSLEFGLKSKSPITKQNIVSGLLDKLQAYIVEYERIILSKKKGLIRRYILSTRSHFSFRLVITSITRPHEYNKIEVPWFIGLTTYRLHVVNKLLKRGYNYREIIRLVNKCLFKYDPLIDEILNELISESKHGGLPCLTIRYPSLLRGSIQTVFISKFKTDVMDMSYGIPILLLVAQNGDIDGDTNTVSCILDNYMLGLLTAFNPEKNALLATKPHEVSTNINLPKPVMFNMSSMIADGGKIDETKLSLFNTIPYLSE